MSRELLLILLFTLHWSGVSCCVWDNCAGEELPQLFTTLHPLFTLIFFWGCEIFSWIRLRSSAFNGDQLRPSMVTSFGLQWWPASSARRPGGFEIRRKKGSTYKDRGICNPPIKGKAYPLLRIANPQSLNRLGHFLTPDFKSGGTPSGLVVKSGEEWWRGEPTLHLSEPQCLSGFQTIWWRVKSKSESSLFSLFCYLFLSSSFSYLLSPSVFCLLPTCRFLPGNGKKLPW